MSKLKITFGEHLDHGRSLPYEVGMQAAKAIVKMIDNLAEAQPEKHKKEDSK